MMEDSEYVDFSTIKQLVGIDDENLFMIYINQIYKDLTDRSESDKKFGIRKITFYDYTKLPVFIAEKLFNAFDKDRNDYLNHKEFNDGMLFLYFGNFTETARVIFDMLDFDRDGKVYKSDIKTTLSYLPLKDSSHTGQMESLKEIDEMLDFYFMSSDYLRFEKFIDLVKNNKSDVYFQMLCFLYQNKPFNVENVVACRNYKKGKTSTRVSPLTGFKHEEVIFKSPSKSSKLKPAEMFIESLNLDDSFEDFSIDTKKIDVQIKLPQNRQIKKIPQKFDQTPVLVSKEMIRLPNQKENDGRSHMASPTKYLKETPKVENFRIENQVKPFNDQSYISPMIKKKPSDHLKNKTPTRKLTVKQDEAFTYSNWIYKLTENGNLKTYYLSVVGKDIFYYKSDSKDDLQGMHNLTGSFIKEIEDTIVNGKKVYGFSIVFSNKNRNFYVKTQEELSIWISKLKKAIGYESFSDFYEFGSSLGQGKFGLVKLGIHKKTGEKVAIKIIKKVDMELQDVELVRSEIDIMKLCRHSNVVRLLDHFENFDYIFIVMEYLAGGDLGHYLKKREFKFEEKEAALVIRQICEGLNYLHSYGVVHRDLKPDNIMLSRKNSLDGIKIMDFGLSKIMSPLERAEDGFGTLCFVAPEVLTRSPYNNEVDIWSVGVTLFYMLTGLLPFDDDSDNEEVIAKKIVFTELSFAHKKWQKFSKEVKKFISSCLVKNPKVRATIRDLMDHPWIKFSIN